MYWKELILKPNMMQVKQPKIRPWMLKKEIIILYYGLWDKRTNLLARIPALLSVIYLLSPVDLIPDFIPFFGYIDDLVIVPLLLNLSIQLLPAKVREESISKTNRNFYKFKWLAVLLILLLIGWFVGIFFLIRHLLSN
jgi:uncharacterized membrane protein YkvA (DUF1232 family)